MGVYIPGMEPVDFETGRKYVAEFTVYFDGRVDLGIVTSGFLEKPKIVKHFPCVSIPPHGRLIDGDALYESAYRALGINNEVRSDLGILIAYAPTIIPAKEEA